MRRQLLSLFVLLICGAERLQAQKGFEILEDKAKKEVKVLWNSRLLTAYCYHDSLYKPFLFPLNTLDGVTVTRGWPLVPRAGERTDHPHHTGVWMNYESVNGLDFWNNSTAIPEEKKHLYGKIRHRKFMTKRSSKDRAIVAASADWLHPDGHTLLRERTIYNFSIKDSVLLINRSTNFTAVEDVEFKDVKDGFFAIRVARELEMPSSQEDVFTDVHGNKTTLAKMKNNDGVTGQYLSSQGRSGDSVWGTRANWTVLQGRKDGKAISIGIVDHRNNVGYPAYWHARGYGLFAVNPFGQKVFSNGKETLNFTLKKGESRTFRYLLVLASGKQLTPAEMGRLAEEFNNR